MGTDLKDTLTFSLDSLESAFSDSTRKVLRQIKTEWQKVMSYRNELSSKEDELLSLKEKVTHLNELKSQNEKYLNTSQSRLNNLKQSNVQLKVKLNHLKKEEERLAKKCSEEGEYLRKKLSFYEEKWRQRYQVYCAKDPKMRERENSIRELEGLKEKLSTLDQELQKYEKDLFRARCERNGRTSDEMKMCPFRYFVIKIAQLYVDTKKVLGECNKISREIAAIERNIQIQKLKQQLHHSNLENSGLKSEGNATNSFDENMGLARDSLRFTPMQSHMITESNISEQIFENSPNYSTDRDQQMEICNDDHPLQTITTMNNENTEEGDRYTSKFEPNAITNDGFGCHRDAYFDLNKSVDKSPLSRFMEDIPISVGTRPGITVSSKTTPKTEPKHKKVRGWLDRLKIFIPTFSKTTETVRTCDVDDVRKKAEPRNVKEIKPTDDQTLEKTRKAGYEKKEYTQTPKQHKNSPGFKILEDEGGMQNVTVESMLPATGETLERYISNLDVRSIPIQNEQGTSEIKNTSKYFSRDSPDMRMDWDATEDNEIKKTFGEVNKEEVVVSVKPMKVQDNSAHKVAADNLKEALEPGDKEDRNEEPKGQDYSSRAENIPIEITNANSRERQSIIFKSGTAVENMKSPAKRVSFMNEIQHSSLKDDDNDYQIKFGNLKVDNEQIAPVRSVEQMTSLPPHVANLKSTAQDLTREATTDEHQKLSPLQVQKDDSSNDLSSGNDKDIDKLDCASESSTTDITINSPYPSCATPQSVDQTQRSSDSNPKTPMVTTAPNAATSQQDDDLGMSSSICHFKPESMSPGFAYTTRLMYENGAAAGNKKEPSNKQMTKELQSSMFAQLSYFGRSPNRLNFTGASTPEEDKNEFLLVSAFEDYLTDSPPNVKGTEKSMFTFAEESPETEGKNDFFPLFAADNGESSKDSKNNEGGQFMFNFGATGSEKSPEETSGFKFTF